MDKLDEIYLIQKDFTEKFFESKELSALVASRMLVCRVMLLSNLNSFCISMFENFDG